MAINLNDILSRFDEKEHTHILIDLLREYIYLIRSHMDVEESKSFPRAKQVLTDDDWSEIDEGFSYKDDPLFGKIIYKQYQDIYDSIVK
jgi:branched-chain amino acid transport system ATP-binding protein